MFLQEYYFRKSLKNSKLAMLIFLYLHQYKNFVI